jgi:DNA helicase-2/ATP-dependent DNA helicase PcrA
MLNCDIGAIVAGLNREQAGAVTAGIDRPVLVLAGAGCGKTTVLTRRIAYLAGTFCPGPNILALTFTRAAAREMAQRVAAFPQTGGAAGLPLVTTFHAFCLRLLLSPGGGAPMYSLLGYPRRPRLVSERLRLQMIARASTRDERTALCASVLELSAMLSRRAVLSRKNPSTEPNAEAALRDIECRYSGAKKELGLWDFSDFVTGAIELFDAHPSAARTFASHFHAVLVDEFQDTNPAQMQILQRLLVPGVPLFAVGDDDQAIYGFQGADRAAVLDFGARFPGAEILKLQTNYRSTPAILSAANRIFRAKPRIFRKVLVAGRPADAASSARRAVTKTVLDSDDDMVRYLVSAVRRLVSEDGVPMSDIAILFRLNQTLDRIGPMFAAGLGSCERLPHMLTVHGSKGREFDTVFLCDLEEGVFPKKQANSARGSWRQKVADLLGISGGDDGEMGEEKRLFYVGVTRAKRVLHLVSVRRKMLYGRTRTCAPSRFVRLV